MSVHQLKDGRWYVQYRDKDRTKKFKRKYFGRGLDAKAKAEEYNVLLGLRPYQENKPKDHSAFFVDLVNGYADARLAHIQESTLENFMWKMKGVILPQLGHFRTMSITPKRLDGYVKMRLKKVKKTTVHRELSDIRAVLNWAARRRYIAFNPIANYEMPKRDDEVIIPPSETEINLILKNAPDRLIRAISISYYTGLRPGQKELFSMKWANVDFIKNTILVESAKKKSKFKTRLVPVHPDFTAILKVWFYNDNDPDGYIVNYRGKAVKSLKKAYATAKKKAGITRRLRMYDIRHAFASTLLKNGADLKATSELLGHSRTDTTTRIYQHTDFEMHQDAVKRLAALDIDTTLVQQKSSTKIIEFKNRKISNL
jgi:integrase